MIIVIEGPDGSGKSSVIEYLSNNLYYSDIRTFHLPIRESSVYMKKHLESGEYPFEAQFESIFQQRALFCNLSEYYRNPKNIAIISRSVPSTYVYGFSDFKNQNIPSNIVKDLLCSLVKFVPKPDLGFFLMPKFECLQKRRIDRNNKEENLDIYEKENIAVIRSIYDRYANLCTKINKCYLNRKWNWLSPYTEIKIDDSESIEDISLEIEHIIADYQAKIL